MEETLLSPTEETREYRPFYPWIEYNDDAAGGTYFWNEETGESSREMPIVDLPKNWKMAVANGRVRI
jgi:hypothetical protein